MTIRRVDFWEVKPGKLEALKQLHCDMNDATSHHGNTRSRLALVTHGHAGPPNLTAGHCYTLIDFESAARYGETLEAVNADSKVQEIWAHLHSEASPAVHRGTGLLRRTEERGTPPGSLEGSVALSRAWKVAPGLESVARTAGLVVHEHAAQLGGYLQVHRPMLGASGAPNAIVSTTFPSWKELGQFFDKLGEDQELQAIAAPFMSATPPASQMQAHTCRIIAA